MKSSKTIILLITLITFFSESWAVTKNRIEVCNNRDSIYLVRNSSDFEVTGDGRNINWDKANWLDLTQRSQVDVKHLVTRVKSLYSEKGLYFLFECNDSILTSTMDSDFLDLWKEDVVEVFLWPDERYPVYFEYELSPMNHELVLLISNNDGELLRWQPFHYESNRTTMRNTSIIGGKKESFANVNKWISEFFIPYKLLKPLNFNVPEKGDRWRANFYRVDYDDDKSVSWSWQKTRTNFHDYECFGSIVFE